MEEVSLVLQGIFIFVTLLVVIMLYYATRKWKMLLFVLLAWMAIQLFIGESGFYIGGKTQPARFLLLAPPALAGILILFVSRSGRHFIDSFDAGQLTLLHSIRVPVEIVLYFLFLEKNVPQVMTFEGRNFDILAGLTAPLVFYFGYVRKKLPVSVLVAWNIGSLFLLFNIIILAVLSAPSPFQQLGFEQPNTAIAHFPFNWLPSVVVPVVLLAHLASLRQLLKKKAVTPELISG